MIRSKKEFVNRFTKKDKLTVVEFTNGFKLIMNQNKRAQQKASIFVNYGSAYDEYEDNETGEKVKLPQGIAHFLEHKIFDKIGEPPITELYDNTNAYTSYAKTYYYVGVDENIFEAIEQVVKLVFRPSFSKETIAKEQGIIGQEIDGNLTRTASKLFDNLTKIMYDGNSIAYPILGTKETIATITPEMLYNICSNFYTTGNTTMLVTGDFEIGPVIGFVEALLEEYAKQETYVPKIDLRKPVCSTRLIVQDEPTNLDHMLMGFRLPGDVDGIEKIKYELLIYMYNKVYFSELSNFFQKAMKDGIIAKPLSVFNEDASIYDYMVIFASSKDYKITKDYIVNYINDYVLKDEIDDELFNVVKKSEYGVYYRIFTSVNDLESNIVQTVELNIENPYQLLESISALTKKDFMEYKKIILNPDNLFTSVLRGTEK